MNKDQVISRPKGLFEKSLLISQYAGGRGRGNIIFERNARYHLGLFCPLNMTIYILELPLHWLPDSYRGH